MKKLLLGGLLFLTSIVSAQMMYTPETFEESQRQQQEYIENLQKKLATEKVNVLKKQQELKAQEMRMCTMEFRSITVDIVDKNMHKIQNLKLTVKDAETGKIIPNCSSQRSGACMQPQMSMYNMNPQAANYIIANDSFATLFKGQKISPGQKVSRTFIVSTGAGGKTFDFPVEIEFDGCHVTLSKKTSGIFKLLI